jgi:predicted acylesterase/phospholipase RssA
LEIIHSVVSSKILDKIQTDINIEQLLGQQGIISFEHFHEELELITLAKHGEVFTMKSLYDKLGKELCCITFNYTLNKTVILHYTTTPDLPCLIALQMSSSIPFVFGKMTYEDSVYIDGGISDNFPIRVALRMGKTNILGICSNSSDFKDDDSSPYLGLVKIITLPIILKTSRTIRKYRKRCQIIDIPINEDILNFGLNVSEIMEMFSTGYKTCKDIFTKTSN